MGHVMFRYYSDINPVFANNTWSQIITACQTGNIPCTWNVGNQKVMNIGGTDYIIDIIGKNHDDYADGSGKAPITFQLHDLYETKYVFNSNNTNKWEDSEIRNIHLPSIMELMPREVQSNIREVIKETTATSDLVTTTTADKLFLLSYNEVKNQPVQTTSGNRIYDGEYYAYYILNDVSKTINNVVDYWWTRSPSDLYAKIRLNTIYSSDKGSYNIAESSQGVSFAFCF